MARLLQQLIGLEAKLNQYEQGERFIEAVERVGGQALLRPGLGEPPNGSPPSTRSATRPRGSRGSHRRWPADRTVRRDGAHPDDGSDPVADRRGRTAARPLPVPGARHAGDLRRVGRGRLAWPAGAGRGGRCPDDRRPRRPRAAARLGRRGRGRRRRRPTASAPASAPNACDVEPGPNLEARARAARRRGPARRTACSATPPTTRPRPCCSTCCAAPASTGWPASAPTPATRSWLSAGTRPTPCAITSASVPVEDPSNADPRHRRNRVRHEVLPLLDDVAERDVVPVLARQAGLLREVADLLDRSGRRSWIPPMPPHWPPPRLPLARRRGAGVAARPRSRAAPSRRRHRRAGAGRRPARGPGHRRRRRLAGRPHGGATSARCAGGIARLTAGSAAPTRVGPAWTSRQPPPWSPIPISAG